MPGVKQPLPAGPEKPPRAPHSEVTPAHKPLSLKKNVVVAVAGSVIYSLTQWLILATVIKLSSSEVAGVLTLATALVNPIFFIASMSMREGQAVDDLKRFQISDYFALKVFNKALALAVVWLTLLAFYADRGSGVLLAIVAFSLLKSVASQSEFNYAVFQRNERLDFVATSMILRGVGGALVFAITFYFTRDLAVSLLNETLAWILVSVSYDREKLVQLGVVNRFLDVLQCQPRHIFQLFWWLLPLTLAGFLSNLAISIPRLVAEENVSLRELGILGAIAYINMALMTLTNTISNAASRRLAVAYQLGKKQRFMSLSLRLVLASGGLGMTVLVAGYFFGELGLRIVYSAEYAARANILHVVLISTAIQLATNPLQFAITAGQAFYRRMFTNLLTVVVSLGLSLLLVPTWGIVGAAWALVGATGVRGLASVWAFALVALQLKEKSDEPEASEPALQT